MADTRSSPSQEELRESGLPESRYGKDDFKYRSPPPQEKSESDLISELIERESARSERAYLEEWENRNRQSERAYIEEWENLNRQSEHVPTEEWRRELENLIKSYSEPANPQSFAYFSFLFAVVGIITFLLGAVRPLLRQNPSLFKAHGGVFTIMIIVSGCMAVLSSFVLVLSSFLLKNWMKNIHYTILKTIGSFSAILVPLFLGAAVFVPSGDLNWITYTDLCVTFGVLLYLYSRFIWNVACAYHQNERYNSYPVHWAYLLIILVPFSISLLSFFSPNLRSLATVYVSLSIIAPSVIFFMRFNREDIIAFLRFNRKDKGD